MQLYLPSWASLLLLISIGVFNFFYLPWRWYALALDFFLGIFFFFFVSGHLSEQVLHGNWQEFRTRFSTNLKKPFSILFVIVLILNVLVVGLPISQEHEHVKTVLDIHGQVYECELPDHLNCFSPTYKPLPPLASNLSVFEKSLIGKLLEPPANSEKLDYDVAVQCSLGVSFVFHLEVNVAAFADKQKSIQEQTRLSKEKMELDEKLAKLERKLDEEKAELKQQNERLERKLDEEKAELKQQLADEKAELKQQNENLEKLKQQNEGLQKQLGEVLDHLKRSGTRDLKSIRESGHEAKQALPMCESKTQRQSWRTDVFSDRYLLFLGFGNAIIVMVNEIRRSVARKKI